MRTDVDLKSVQCFVTLAEELNFGRAATRMAITQPSFSSQIRKLEDHLGTALFVRSTRQVGLSAAGEALLEPARRLVGEAATFSGAMAALSPRMSATVVLGTPFYTYDLPEHDRLLQAMAQDLPEVTVSVDNGFTPTLVEGLIGGEVDLALVLATPVPPEIWRARRASRSLGELEVPDDLPRLVLRCEPMALAIPREHPLAEYSVIPRSALAGQPVAMLSTAHGDTLRGPILAALVDGGAQVLIPPEAHGIALERYCRRYRVPAVSIGWFRDESDGDVVYRPVEGVASTSELALVRGPREWRSPSARKVWELSANLFA